MAVSDGAHVSLPAMASVVGLSTYHFCRAFKQSTGPPPHRCQNRLRLERAKDLFDHLPAFDHRVGAEPWF
ncbi:MAG: AraC family transcriptional regulator [Sphingomonadales bacterium]|jgi:transcriptional regulator GlxA family with amidase domain|uniref:AraC family transcriptional regulator n=1 Tax=Blastomonas natatoria TaxID=34015 RepID=UPI000D75ECC0|nr:AraC family transcriptional regulator [Blastomonas natatoria]TXG82153.1 MAG: AraC family transcriptional regulator [Sphingomonadales bacterium]